MEEFRAGLHFDSDGQGRPQVSDLEKLTLKRKLEEREGTNHVGEEGDRQREQPL